jgi:folate-binding protein YgfZ
MCFLIALYRGIIPLNKMSDSFMNTRLETPVYCDLSELSIARISGDDAQRFLQGQLSNDITHLSTDSAHQTSAYCNPKGRMLALFHVLFIDGDYLLVAPHAILDKVLPRLKMFVMRSAVEITPRDKLFLTGLLAPGITDEKITEINATGTHVIRHINDHDRYFLLHNEKIDNGLKSGTEWNRLDIEQNLPQIFIESYEELIPQSVNLDVVGGVNFKKGCFPGQEIIARVKYRGKPKSRMIGVKLPGNAAVEVGAPVYIEERDRSAGTVINTAHEGDSVLLSINVPVTYINEGSIYLDEDKTIRLERISSPYEIPI